MKKIFAGVLFSSCLFTGAAYAAPTAIDSGNTVGTVECELLGEPVVVTLSNNVHGAYNCTKDNNSITVSTCHAAGSRKVGPERCAIIGTDTSTNPASPIYNNAACQGTGPTDTFNVDNKGKAFQGSTTGGSTAAVSLGAFCDDTSVTATLN